jgi:hypothetical protein
MVQKALPFLLMRGGTSRGPYFNRADLPEDRDTLSRVLIAAIGSGHSLNIDGIGGGAVVTTKVAMLSLSTDAWADIDYFFAQVSVEDKQVDYKPTCGNILSGVGPAALEMGLMAPAGDETEVRIRAVNTGASIVAKVQTPNKQLRYGGDVAIDGVPGTAAPIELQFMDVVGGATGTLLPTGNPVDVIDGIPGTCMDVAMPVVIARAADFGLSGYETPQELDENKRFYDRLEPIRIEAGRRMGLGEVHASVVPKFGLLAPPRGSGAICARYFTPWKCHPSMAVTGGQCLASCLLTPGTVAEGMAALSMQSPERIAIEHPCGKIDIIVDYAIESERFILKSAGLIRTARKIAAGELFIPARIWS